MKTVWHIIPILFCLFHIGSMVSKVKEFRLSQNLVLTILGSYLIYAFNINWGRYFILFSHLIFVFLIFNGKKSRSLFIPLFGTFIALFNFPLGYSIVGASSLYWVLLYSNTKGWRLELRYFSLMIFLEVIFLMFNTVGLFWAISFLASRFYGSSLLNLILVSDHIKDE